MNRDHRRKGSSACAPAEAAIERKLPSTRTRAIEGSGRTARTQILREPHEIAIGVLYEELALALLLLRRDLVPGVLDGPECRSADGKKVEEDHFGVWHLDLKVDSPSERVVQRLDVPAVGVLLFQPELCIPKFDLGEWRIGACESN